MWDDANDMYRGQSAVVVLGAEALPTGQMGSVQFSCCVSSRVMGITHTYSTETKVTTRTVDSGGFLTKVLS